MARPMLETVTWWLEAHPGLILGLHVAVVIGGVLGTAAAVRYVVRATRGGGPLGRRAIAVFAGALALITAVLFTGGTLKIGPRLLADATTLRADIGRLRYRSLAEGRVQGIPTEGVVVVALWATWCRPCVEELDLLARVHARGNATVIHLSQEDPARIRAFLSERPESGSTHGTVDADAWFPAEKLPTLLIVREGRIRGLLRGSTTDEQLSWAISRARKTS